MLVKPAEIGSWWRRYSARIPPVLLGTKENSSMDAHFTEYLAAVWAMREIYGEHAEDFPTEFHNDAEPFSETERVRGALASEHRGCEWDAILIPMSR
jgi:hypothetical protein